MKQIIKIFKDDNNHIQHELLTLPKKDHLHFFYKQLDCRYIDIIRRKIGGQYFDLIIDDEGKIANKKSTALMLDARRYVVDEIAGAFLIASADDEGETIPLTEEQQKHILATLESTFMIQDEYHIAEFLILEY